MGRLTLGKIIHHLKGALQFGKMCLLPGNRQAQAQLGCFSDDNGEGDQPWMVTSRGHIMAQKPSCFILKRGREIDFGPASNDQPVLALSSHTSPSLLLSSHTCLSLRFSSHIIAQHLSREGIECDIEVGTAHPRSPSLFSFAPAPGTGSL